MSKDFEKEYIELAQNEIPDLWDRIEAGLTEKSAPENVIAASEKDGKNKASITIFHKRYAGLAAAILCVALIIPASILIGQTGSKDSASTTEASQELYETAEAEISEEACDTAAATAVEEAYDLAAEAGEEEAEDAGEKAETTGEEFEATELAEAMAEMDTASDARASVKETNEDMSSETASGAMDLEKKKQEAAATVLKNVTVQVMKEDNDVYREDGSPLGGTVYTVIICDDPTGTLEKGEEIEVYLSVYSSVIMSVGSEFEIDIACENSGEYQFVVDKIHLREK